MKTSIEIARLAAGLSALLAVNAFGQAAQLGPLARMAIQQQSRATTMSTLQRFGMVRSGGSGAAPDASVLVRFAGGAPDVSTLGGRVNWATTDVASVDVPVGKLAQLGQVAGVVFAELAAPLRPDLDVAAVQTGASALRAGTPPDWYGDTGRNVLVGLLDTGIDLTHADFRDATGKTRIVQLFDYTTGQNCTQAQIDAGGCSEVDTDGHGTHVAGIAAGNGSATGNGQPGYRYVGVAPEASLVIAKNAWTTENVVQAVLDVETVAKDLDRPLVINLSLGTEIGPHDGTDNAAHALDESSGPGRILVISAGNHASDGSHARATVAQDGASTTSLSVPVDTELTLVDIWYVGADQMAVSVSDGLACSSGTVLAPTSTENTEQAFCNGRVIVESENVNPLNGDREILVTFAASASEPFATSAWTVQLQGTVITRGIFDAWVNHSTSGAKFGSNLSAADTLGSFAAAGEPITVAAYNTKNAWTSLAGPISVADSNPLGEIAYFSSRGPRRACSLVAACPTVQKPEIAAPGAWLASSYSAQTVWADGSCSDCYIDPDGVHSLRQGTSMSAPMVTGAVAALLQLAPDATPAQIKDLLERNATVDDAVGTSPNDTWGFGKLDVKTAFDAMPVALPAAPTGVAAVASGAAATLSWSPTVGLDVDGYRIYRASVSGGAFERIATVPYSAASYADSGLSAGTYYYVVKTLDTKDQESLPSTQVQASIESVPVVPTTPSASDGGGGALGWLEISVLAALAACGRVLRRRRASAGGS